VSKPDSQRIDFSSGQSPPTGIDAQRTADQHAERACMIDSGPAPLDQCASDADQHSLLQVFLRLAARWPH